MTTLNVHVSTSASDGYQTAIGGGCSITPTTLDNLSVANYWATRFANTTIPKDAVIVSATVSIDVYSTKYPTINTVIWGEAANNSAAITTAVNNITNRTKTSASTAWSTTVGTTGFATSPDISAQIQEIVNRASWASGNALTLLWYNDVAGNVSISSWDNANTNEPYLDVVYYVGQVVFQTSISSGASVGSPTLSPGQVSVSVSSIGSTATYGTPTLNLSAGGQTLTTTSIASGSSLGAPVLTPGVVTLTLTSIDSTLNIGVPIVSIPDQALSVDLNPFAWVLHEHGANVFEDAVRVLKEKGISVKQ